MTRKGDKVGSFSFSVAPSELPGESPKSWTVRYQKNGGPLQVSVHGTKNEAMLHGWGLMDGGRGMKYTEETRSYDVPRNDLGFLCWSCRFYNGENRGADYEQECGHPSEQCVVEDNETVEWGVCAQCSLEECELCVNQRKDDRQYAEEMRGEARREQYWCDIEMGGV